MAQATGDRTMKHEQIKIRRWLANAIEQSKHQNSARLVPRDAKLALRKAAGARARAA